MVNSEQTPNPETKEILCRKEVLDLFQISPQTLRNWQRKKLLNGIKISRRVYFSRKEIDALFNQETGSNER